MLLVSAVDSLGDEEHYKRAVREQQPILAA